MPSAASSPGPGSLVQLLERGRLVADFVFVEVHRDTVDCDFGLENLDDPRGNDVQRSLIMATRMGDRIQSSENMAEFIQALNPLDLDSPPRDCSSPAKNLMNSTVATSSSTIALRLVATCTSRRACFRVDEAWIGQRPLEKTSVNKDPHGSLAQLINASVASEISARTPECDFFLS